MSSLFIDYAISLLLYGFMKILIFEKFSNFLSIFWVFFDQKQTKARNYVAEMAIFVTKMAIL